MFTFFRIRISFIAKIVQTNKEFDSDTVLSIIKNIFLNVQIYTTDFTIEYNVRSVQVCMVLFWNSDCQVFIRETAWGKKLSLWQLVLADSALQRRPEGKSLNSLCAGCVGSAEILARMCGTLIMEEKQSKEKFIKT
ncbi:hypothetical protein ATANTOWER_014923 [Ataeniobius toweri]|uniref:Uncharacterized protein n=1 Tax=Ataeniobius toweri TaxID=208326 RepID=A0ABU7B0M0_9TELE|nr:hypothetical protein [Ataeniobius toweri]